MFISSERRGILSKGFNSRFIDGIVTSKEFKGGESGVFKLSYGPETPQELRDVANKIGTYLKALAARDNDIPFYVGLPSPTIDWTLSDGVRDIPIEERDQEEVTHISGKAKNGDVVSVQLTPDGSPAGNFAFDVTPARLVTGLITERGICPAKFAIC